ncbi:MAG TPA: CvpA family protein [Thioploca sp.]|nr:MAG: CvpA family protein [Gammaproteobacteria bacterium]HDN25944.1 CvpA family protein [Thioploca sp.]
MNWADFSIITLILLSGVISYLYGFVKELFSFLVWFLSFATALIFLEGLASLLTTWLPFADIRLGVAFAILFFSSFLLLEWLNYLILNSIGPTDLSVPDRVLGILFGTARSSVIVTVLIMLGGLSHIPATTWWQESVFIQTSFKPIVVELRRHLPFEIATHFNFEPVPEQSPPSF